MVYYFLILLLIAIGIWVYQNSLFIRFEVEGSEYQIQKGSPNRVESLDTLIKIRKRLDQLVAHLNRKYPDNPYSKRLKHRFQNTVLREANPSSSSSDTSYTINKGDIIVLCLRTNNKQLVDINTLTYVAVHELAHIYSSSYHHSKEFWENMAFMIDEAASINVYQLVNYTDNPVHYCGIVIASNIPRSGQQKGGSNLLSPIQFIMSRSGVRLSK